MCFWHLPYLFFLILHGTLVSVAKSVSTNHMAHQSGAYLSFCSIMGLGIFILPPGLDACLSQGFTQH